MSSIIFRKSTFYLFSWFVFIFIMSLLIPYFSNDYRYQLIEGTDDFVRSFSDVFVSQYRHYFDWGGRSVAHVIAQSLLLIGKPYSSIIQGLCYVTMILFIYYHAYGIKPTLKLRLMPLIFITACLWICLRAFGEVTLMVVSSCNYLYTTTILLMFSLPFRLSIKKEKSKDSYLFAIAMFFFGIIAGWCNENSSAAMVAMIGLLNLYHIKQKTLTKWQLLGGIGLLIGFALLIFSPGNQVRVDFMEEKGFNYWSHFFTAFVLVLQSIGYQYLILITLAIALYKIHKQNLHVDNMPLYIGSWFNVIIGLLSILIMTFSPTVPARSATATTVFLTAGTLGFIVLYTKSYTSLLGERARAIFTGIFIVYLSATAVNTVMGYYQASIDNAKVEKEIQAQLQAGSKNLVVSPFAVRTNKYIYIADVNADKNNWKNLILKRYYHVDSIVKICEVPKEFLPDDFRPFEKIGDPKCTADSKVNL